MAGSLFATVALAFLLKGLADTRQSATVAVGGTVLGVTWIGLGLVALLALRALPEHGRLAAFTVLIAVWAGDTFAYLVGRVVGRHKLAPTISPGKTWEGFVGGTAATVFVTFVALYKDRDEFLSIGQALLLGAALAAAAPLGDLFESLLKRDMGVKDSGRLLAGHGGVLDRIDAQLFAVGRRVLRDPRLRQGLALVRPAGPRLGGPRRTRRRCTRPPPQGDRNGEIRAQGKREHAGRVTLDGRRHTVPVRRVALIGATGSIGRQAVEIVEAHPGSSSSRPRRARLRSTVSRR